MKALSWSVMKVGSDLKNTVASRKRSKPESESGIERWQLNLIVLWLTQVITLTGFGFGIPFIPYYIQELGVTDPIAIKTYTGMLSAAPAITMAIMSPIWGILSDRFGQKLMIQRAMFTAVFIIGGMGFVQNVWQLMILRLFQGIFTGTVTASSAFIAVNTPNKKLSYALGILSSSTFVGYMLGPLCGGYIAELWGYRMSFAVGGAIMLFGSVLVTVFLKESRVVPKGEPKPANTSLEGHGKGAYKGKSKMGQLITGSIGTLLVVLFFHRILRTVFAPFMPLYIQELLSSTLAIAPGPQRGIASLTGTINGVVGLMTALSAVLIGKLSERFSKVPLMITLMGIGFALALAMPFTQTIFWFTVSYSALFFVIGGVEPIITAMTAEQTDPSKRGALFGLQGLVGSLGWMVSPMIGTILSVQMGYKAILWGQLGLIAVVFVILCWLYNLLCK